MQTAPRLAGRGNDRRRRSIALALLSKCTYLSCDELERADAFHLGVETVIQHPREVGILGRDEVLVIDFDHILFDDKAAMVPVIRRLVANQVPVGIHSYNPDHPLLQEFSAEPWVVLAKTHRKVRAELVRHGLAQIGPAALPRVEKQHGPFATTPNPDIAAHGS